MSLLVLSACILLARVDLTSAQNASSDDDIGTTSLVAPTPTSTVSLSSFSTDLANNSNTAPFPNAVPVQVNLTDNSNGLPFANAIAGQVNATGGNWAGHSYFFLDYDCYGNFDLPDDQKQYVSRGRFLERAIADATSLAYRAGQWPASSFSRNVSDLYVGKDFHTSKYQQNFSENLLVASKWNHPGHYHSYFRPYISVRCDDTENLCTSKIGKDTRSIAAYANNTKTFFGNPAWRINVCDLFFTRNDIQRIYDQNKDSRKETLSLAFMMSAGAAFLHEMMHLTSITQDRTHIVDSMFDGAAGKRIYGPKDVAKAARIASRENDFSLQAYNADTYAVFAQAFFWAIYLDAVIPPYADRFVAPANATEDNFAYDSDVNYIEYDFPPESLGNDTDTDDGNSTATNTASPPPPAFPSPSCLPAAEGGIIIDNAITALGDFCTTETGNVSAGAQPISKTYDGGETHTIRLTLSWDDTSSGNGNGGSCPDSQSPTQNAGRDCNTIFHSILSGCPEDNYSDQNGGSVTWNCGYYYLGFDQGTPDVPPPTSTSFSEYPTPT